jgi:hypothetical protein
MGKTTERERDLPRIHEFITNYTKERRKGIATNSLIMRNRHQTTDIRHQPRGMEK